MIAPSKSEPLISVVVPCYNESDVFPLLREALLRLADQLLPNYRVEFVLVDDGSRDATWEQMVAFGSVDSRVRAIALSRNFGQQLALTCGYDFAEGDAVVSLDADLQDPPEVILDLITEWEKGADIVYAVRTQREGEKRFKRWSASLFYRLMEQLSPTSLRNSGDFRLMSRRSITALRQLREKHRFIRGMVGWIGFQTSVVSYERKSRLAGKTKFTLPRMIHFAMDAIVSSSIIPLRLAYLLSVMASIPFLSYLGYAFVCHVFFHAYLAPGWSSLILSVIILGGLILFCLGVMGEYIGRIYEQSKERPLYLIREEKFFSKTLDPESHHHDHQEGKTVDES